MKNLVEKIFGKVSAVVAVICFFLMACEAETDEGIVVQLVAVAVFGLLVFINRKKWLAE